MNGGNHRLPASNMHKYCERLVSAAVCAKHSIVSSILIAIIFIHLNLYMNCSVLQTTRCSVEASVYETKNLTKNKLKRKMCHSRRPYESVPNITLSVDAVSFCFRQDMRISEPKIEREYQTVLQLTTTTTTTTIKMD